MWQFNHSKILLLPLCLMAAIGSNAQQGGGFRGGGQNGAGGGWRQGQQGSGGVGWQQGQGGGGGGWGQGQGGGGGGWGQGQGGGGGGGWGQGKGGGGFMQHGHTGGESGKWEALEIIWNILENTEKIHRNVDRTDFGVETQTWSDDEQVTGWLQQHVEQMIELHDNGDCIRMWDPLFSGLCAHHGEMILSAVKTPQGVNVTNGGDSDCAKELARVHANAVSLFVQNGRTEAWKEHDVVPVTCKESRH